MAMSEEELQRQIDILTTNTKDNEGMVYNSVAILNTGLNPDYFTGNNTSIVNAINLLAQESVTTNEVAQLVADKVNEILLDISNDENKLIWDNLKELMEIDTVIEGIQRILQGKQQDKILGIAEEDIGKILMVDQADDGEMMVKPVDLSLGETINAENVIYENPDYTSLTNVAEAIDLVLNNIEESGIVGDIKWEMITDAPDIPNKLELTDERLVLRSDEGDVSSVELVTDEDIQNIIADL